MPGIAASTNETWLLGSPPNSVEAPENSFEFEVTWAWISSPMTTSQSPVAPLISFDDLTGAFITFRLSKKYLGSLGFAQRMAPVKPEKLTFSWSKPATERLVGPALAQRVGAAFDQKIDLVRRQHEPRRNGVENARARRSELVEIHPIEEEGEIAATPVIADAEAHAFCRRQAASPALHLADPVVDEC